MVPSVSPWTDEQAQRKKHKRSHCSDAPRKNLHSSRERDQLLRSDSGHLTHPDCWAFVFLCCFIAVEQCDFFFFYWFSLLHRPCRPLWSRTLTFLRALRDKITTSPFSTFLLGPHRGRTPRQPPPPPAPGSLTPGARDGNWATPSGSADPGCSSQTAGNVNSTNIHRWHSVLIWRSVHMSRAKLGAHRGCQPSPLSSSKISKPGLLLYMTRGRISENVTVSPAKWPPQPGHHEEKRITAACI